MASKQVITEDVYVYTGQSGSAPLNITHVKVDPSIMVIGRAAFQYCKRLRIIKFCCEGGRLEQFGDWAFQECISLMSITIPSTVKVIGEKAFKNCMQLRNVELCEG